MTIWLNTSFEMRFRVIDGLTIRFAESHHRLLRNKLDVIDAGHLTWEDAAAEYAAIVTSWWRGGYAASGSKK